MRVTRSLFMLVVGWSVTSGPVFAAEAESGVRTARALAYKGQKAYDAGRYVEAAEAARAAQQLVSAPTLALLEARSLKQLGQFLAARAQYRIAAAPLPPNASQAFELARQAALGELLLLQHELPRLVLELTSPRSEAEEPRVTVDGVLWPTTSFGIWVAQDPGEHVVVATFGARAERYLVQLAPRDEQRLLLGAAGNNSKLRMPLAISAFAVGALGLGAGVGFALHAGNLRSDLEGACPEARCPTASAETLGDYRTARELSTIGYVVGAVGTATGVAVLALLGSEQRESGAPILTLGAGRFDLKGRF